MWKFVLLAIVLALAISLAAAIVVSWTASQDAEKAFAQIEAEATQPAGTFDVAMVEGLPEVARRYFLHAIAPGTPLRTTVRLHMRGEFLLGDRKKSQTYSMTANQVLSPPDQFVWIPTMTSGLVEITGSDGLWAGDSWTRFWLNRIVPVVNLAGGSDMTRSALTRSAMEAIWVPASLLPQHGVSWEQTGADIARLTFETDIEPIDVTLAPDGAVLQITTMRWSNVNSEQQFKFQPFGGTIEGETRFGGFTIPSRVKIGNHFGTPDYLPFFQAEILQAEFLPAP